MANNPISRSSTAWGNTYAQAVDITPHASTEITPTRGIVCVVAGTAAVRFAGSAADVSVQMAAGVVYPYSVKHVRATGTTATGIVALY